jgi:hypothetical protein
VSKYFGYLIPECQTVPVDDVAGEDIWEDKPNVYSDLAIFSSLVTEKRHRDNQY